jgi:preprotein translocase subunit SecA
MFEELMAAIWQEFARVIFHVEVNVEAQDEQRSQARAPQQVNYSGGTEDGQPSALRDAAAAAAAGAPAAAAGAPSAPTATEPPPPEPQCHREPTGTVVKSENEKLGRNDPCWCGSGKKFKNCHGG